ncbi:nucleotide-diphospho-sugar transferase [Gloeophyllum trabeum ATCC 11539]|uniref:Nucleotide-diphospho-sugar transferase n=1 Tax=Gloeophyllum trabeum (strain ATCC 11539 / FP-39264 / Madison 617) TaxID=670483 RepID=S7S029_GLOTA|nr:nucleotide-diphospho-sugar transferase [Gloeophyllum trabeum ATCC 11539]EPQ60695.1 nucleotide-diphospho-sugar transferase [Gloeophyllum trabeum ATCC 11539]
MFPRAAYVSLVTKTEYLPGILVVDHCLKSVGSRYPLVVMVTPTLPEEARNVLARRGIAMREVERLSPRAGSHKLAAHDARFDDTWTKLRAFSLIEYERVVLMDSDMIVRRNMDELMTLDLPRGWIAAAHACACNPRKLKHYPSDWIPENCAYTPLSHPSALTNPTPITDSSPRPYRLLNSGTVVLSPSEEVMRDITNFLHTSPLVATFSFPDQDLLSEFFKGRWKPLPWCYNALKTLRIIHKPLWRDEEIRCLHYILHDKPWHRRIGAEGADEQYEDMHKWWWDMFDEVARDMQKSDPAGWQLVSAQVARA